MQKQCGTLLYGKQQYEPPKVNVVCLKEDAIRTSGKMTWDVEGWGDWTPNRDDTFVN